VWGGIGWLLDRWWGTTFLTPVGVIVGMALGVFAVVARHGGLKTTGVRSIPDPQPGPPPASTRRETECP